MTNFDKAKSKSKKKWWIVRIDNYNFYLWGLPFVPFVLLKDRFDDWQYNRLQWDEAKATKMLNRILPKFLEWVEEDNAYYFCMDWGYSNYQYQVPLWHRKWVRKFASRLREFVRDGYENPKYIKEHENDGYDEWVKFSEKKGLTNRQPHAIIKIQKRKGNDTMTKHYLFEDLETGEEFIVGACDLDEAKEIAADNFERPKFQYRMSEFEAETSGLDEY